jgi:Na+/proline symporter
MESQNPLPPSQNLAPARGRHPVLVLALCALCIYGGLLGILVGVAAQDKLGYFAAAGLALFAAFRLFRHFLRRHRRGFP